MKFIYFGSSSFSKSILEGLYKKGFIPQLVVSKPDKPKGRGLKISATAVSIFSNSKKMPLIKPASLNEETTKEFLSQGGADFFIIIDYGIIIPTFLLSLPKLLAISLHPSLLPRYRGPAPIEYALMNGDKETGITLFKLNERIDAGDIILQRTVTIDYADDYFSLSQKLAEEGLGVLVDGIHKIKDNNYTLIPQDETQATFTTKFKKKDGKINWEETASNIRNLIRAIAEWPSAYSYYKGLRVKIVRADVVEESYSGRPGTVIKIDRQGIYVATASGILKITQIQPQGKRVMDSWSFVCGHRVEIGEQFF